MSASQEIKMISGIVVEAMRLERERVLEMFTALAKQLDEKADADDGEIGLVWTAAAASVRRVCDEGKVSASHDCQISSKDRAFAARINSEAMSGDHECDHGIADDLLCELLLSIGCSESVKAFEAVDKWYA